MACTFSQDFQERYSWIQWNIGHFWSRDFGGYKYKKIFRKLFSWFAINRKWIPLKRNAEIVNESQSQWTAFETTSPTMLQLTSSNTLTALFKYLYCCSSWITRDHFIRLLNPYRRMAHELGRHLVSTSQTKLETCVSVGVWNLALFSPPVVFLVRKNSK